MRNFTRKALCLLSSAVMLCGASAIPASAAETAETTTAALTQFAEELELTKSTESAAEFGLMKDAEFLKRIPTEEFQAVTTTVPVQEFEMKTLPTDITTDLMRRTSIPFRPRVTTTTTTTATTTTTTKPVTTTTAAECKLAYYLNTTSYEIGGSVGGVVIRLYKSSTCKIPGDVTVKYQWYKNGVAISGATEDNYTAREAGTYHCIVIATRRTLIGRTYYNVQVDKFESPKCVVTEKLAIKTQPQSGYIYKSGSTYALSVEAKGGSTPYKYEWTKNGSVVGSAQTYKATSAGTYKCKITDSKGNTVTSNNVTVTDNFLKITKQPQAGKIYTEGGSYTLSVAASGGKAPYKYKWTKFGKDISKTTASISVTEQGDYQCEVTDALGYKVKSNTVYVAFGYLHFMEWRVWGTVYAYDKPVELFATPTGGTAPYRYQWTHDGYIMPNTTAKIYVTSPGTYYLTVYDATNKKITSNPMTVYQSILRFTTQPKTVNSDDYNNYTTLSVAATGGTGTYSYEWQKLNSNGQWVSAGSYRPTLTVYRSDTHTSYTCDGKMYGGRTDLHYLKKYYTCYRCVVKTFDSNGNVVTQITSSTARVYDNVKDYITDVEWAW